jgi:Xaa-Pro aminopeptidase
MLAMYPHQMERLTHALERAGIEALVATSAANVAYITGFRGLTGAEEHATPLAIFTRRGTALVVPANEAVTAVLDESDADRVVAFGHLHGSLEDGHEAGLRRLRSVMDGRAESAPAAVGMALEALGVRTGAVGVDASGLSHQDWERITAGLGLLKVVNGADHLRAARRVKAPFEIECLERALRAAEEALNEVIQVLARGTTEREAAAAYRAEVIKRGADPGRVLIALGERTGVPLAPPTDRALRPGELVRFDVACVHRGYHARVGRTAVLGEPTAEQDAIHGMIQTGLEAAIGAVRPERSAGEVFDHAIAAARAQGLTQGQPFSIGHGIGLEAFELPMLAQGDPTPMEAGEVLQVEMSHYRIGVSGLAIRETLLVAMGGARVLNRSARGLVTLD